MPLRSRKHKPPRAAPPPPRASKPASRKHDVDVSSRRPSHEAPRATDDVLLASECPHLRVVIGPVIGLVTHSTARVLIEFNNMQPVAVTVCAVCDRGSTTKVTKTVKARRPAIFVFTDLRPEAKFKVEIADKIDHIASSFQTRAQFHRIKPTPEVFALTSCNKFTVQEHWDRKHPNSNLWRHMGANHPNISMIIHCGDQVYGDSDAQAGSLDNAYMYSRTLLQDVSPDEWAEYSEDVREFYRNTYRQMWSNVSQARVLANFPNIMIADDHEYCDDFGDDPSHIDPTSLDFFIGMRAHEVYFDYQRQLIQDCQDRPMSSFDADHYAIVLGEIGIIAVEMHACRTFYRKDNLERYPYLGDRQWQDIEFWLKNKMEHVKELIFVSPVPVVYVARKLAKIGEKFNDDIRGHWCYDQNQPEQEKILDCLFEWKYARDDREVTIVSGDVHLGGHADIKWKAKKQMIKQFISSPICNDNLPKGQFEAVKKSLQFGTRVGKYKYVSHSFTRHNNYGIIRVFKNLSQKDKFKKKPPKVTCQLFVATKFHGIQGLTKVSSTYQTRRIRAVLGFAKGQTSQRFGIYKNKEAG